MRIFEYNEIEEATRSFMQFTHLDILERLNTSQIDIIHGFIMGYLLAKGWTITPAKAMASGLLHDFTKYIKT